MGWIALLKCGGNPPRFIQPFHNLIHIAVSLAENRHYFSHIFSFRASSLSEKPCLSRLLTKSAQATAFLKNMSSNPIIREVAFGG